MGLTPSTGNFRLVSRRMESNISPEACRQLIVGPREDSISVIELKYNGGEHSNRKVGIISELFLYSCVIETSSKVSFQHLRHAQSYQKAFYENSCNIASVRAEMLSNGYHPLLENNFILELLNCNAFCDVPVTFGKSSYSYSETNSSLIINRD